MPGERGLLAVAGWPERRRPRASTRRPRPRWAARSRRSPSCAATATRRGSSRRRCCRRGWAPRATTARRRRWPGWRGWSWRATAATPPAEVPVPGGAVAAAARPTPSTPARPSGGSRRAREQLGEEIERLEKKLANERFVERAPAEVVEGERDEAGRVPARARALERRVNLARGRGVPARPRAVRHAVRAGPHAQADDRAGDAPAAVRVDPRGGVQRQVVDRALHRGDPRSATGCGPAATPRRTWRSFRERIEVGEEPVSRGALRRGGGARGRGGGDGRAHAGRRTTG